MKDEDYWKLFWLSGMPEAWLMSRPGRGDFNSADMTARARPHGKEDLPPEGKEPTAVLWEREEQERGG